MKDSTVKDFVKAIKNEKASPVPYDTTATVVRVDGDTVWVHIAGGVDETPVRKTVNAKVGDSVQVRIGGGKAWITGNATAPPTDDEKANIADGKATKARAEATVAKAEATEAKETANAVQGIAVQAAEDASEAKSIADNTNQYFWNEETGTDTGAHITEVPQDEWNDSTNPNYHSGGNLLARSNGIAVRNGLDELATFGTSGAVLGKTTEGKTTVADDGLEVYGYSNGTQQLLAQLKYAIGKNIGYQDEVAPHFILGTRDTTKTIGNWSFSGGYNSNACRYCSFAFGKNVIAEGPYSVAFGESVSAKSSNSVAFGIGTEANATCSEAHGLYTTADGQNQTVFGKWNKSDASNKYALIVGNGTVNGRSNAFAVGWNGVLEVNDGAQIGSCMSRTGSGNQTLTTTATTVSMNATADMDRGNVFDESTNGIKCLYDGLVHVIASVRFASGFTVNDYMNATIYQGSTAVKTSRIRTPFAVYGGDVIIDAYIEVSANDDITIRARNETGGRGTVDKAVTRLTACYVSA